jgi:hypothetical protein
VMWAFYSKQLWNNFEIIKNFETSHFTYVPT